MALDLRPEQETLKAINEKLESKVEPRRAYMGVSTLGTKCDFALWLKFRWALPEKNSGRVLRLLNRGHREEAYIVKLLKSVGVDIQETGRKQRMVWLSAWVGGHPDGIIVSGLKESAHNVHVAEFKTSNEKAWQELSKKGLRIAKPDHYTQMQVYMMGTGIERGFYWNVNKNDDSVYTERIYLDRAFATQEINRGDRIALSSKAPDRLAHNPSWYECKMCKYYRICYQNVQPEMSCRTCEHCVFTESGKVVCSQTSKEKTTAQQCKGCPLYKVHPGIHEELSPWQF